MTKKIVIYGAGALARECFEIINFLATSGKDIDCLGFIVDKDFECSDKLLSKPVYRERSELYGDSSVLYCIAIGDGNTRKRVADSLIAKNCRFTSVIDPRSPIGSTSKIGLGSIIFWNSSVSVDCLIGDHVVINPGCTIAHDNIMGNYTSISPGVNLAGGVECEPLCFIGTGACVRPKIKLGYNSFVGAGSVVVKNVPSNSVIVGNPACILEKNS